MSSAVTIPANAGEKYPSQDSVFFFRLALTITVITCAGFLLSWSNNPEQLGRITLWTGLHGAVSATWFLLLLHQLRLSGRGRIAEHKMWGKLSVLLVIAILVTGAFMALDLYDRLVNFGVFDPADASARVRAGGFIGGAFLQWLIFLVLYILAVLNVKTPVHHKRFMLAAAIQMMPEGVTRLMHLLDLPGSVMLFVILFAYLSMLVYDWYSAKQIYWSTLVSMALFGLLATFIYTIFRTQIWGNWVVSILS